MVGIITADENSVGNGNQLVVDIVDTNERLDSSVGSRIIDISLIGSNGEQGLQPQGNVEICLSVENSDTDGCLAVFNEDTNEWECEDPCLNESDGLICGETSHFSRFSILLDTSNAGGDTKCNSGNSWNGITHIEWADYVIISLTVIIICCVLWVFAFFTAFVKPSFHGREYERIRWLRESSREVTATILE